MTKLTRQHFRALAERIATIPNGEERIRTAHLIGGVCRRFNAGFDWNRWLIACRAVATDGETRKALLFD